MSPILLAALTGVAAGAPPDCPPPEPPVYCTEIGTELSSLQQKECNAWLAAKVWCGVTPDDDAPVVVSPVDCDEGRGLLFVATDDLPWEFDRPDRTAGREDLAALVRELEKASFLLKGAWTTACVGLASNSGSSAHNETLAGERAQTLCRLALEQRIASRAPAPDSGLWTINFGKYKDKPDNPRQRRAVVLLSVERFTPTAQCIASNMIRLRRSGLIGIDIERYHLYAAPQIESWTP